MARTLHADVVTETTAGAVRIAALVDLLIDSGSLYFWSGLGTLSANGNSYTGTGNLGAISVIEDGIGPRATGINLQLSGISSSLISIVLGEHLQGRTAKVYLAFFNSSDAIVGDPVLVFSGRIDTLDIEDTGETCVIDVAVENRLRDFDRPNEVRYYTHEEQDRLFSGDRGLEFVESLQNKEIYWGRRQPDARSPSTPIGGGGGTGSPTGGGGGVVDGGAGDVDDGSDGSDASNGGGYWDEQPGTQFGNIGADDEQYN